MQIRIMRLRGLPLVFVLALLPILVVALVTVAVFVGLAVAALGVIASAVAALYYAVARRRARAAQLPQQAPAALQQAGGVRDIEVNEIIVRKET